MMQSVALSDAQCYTETEEYDYVMVPTLLNNCQCIADEDDNDDQSYDYCDDVLSINSTSSVEQSTVSSVCSEALLTLTQEAVDCSVPSIIKHLDEAHEAAKLVTGDVSKEEDATVLDDNAEIDDDSKENHDTRPTVERTEVDSVCDKNNTNNCTSSDDSSQTLSSEGSDSASSSTLSATRSLPSSVGRKDVSSECAGETISSPHQSDPDADVDADAYNSEPVVMSRLSNKKRRKKMKLMKKAAAAAAAAAAMSEKALSSTSGNGTMSLKTMGSLKKKKPKKNPGRCHSKRVANVAVACAKESIDSYKEQVLNNRNRKVW